MGVSERDRTERSPLGLKVKKPEAKKETALKTDIQVPYNPKSKGVSENNLIPKNLAEPIAKVLRNIEKEKGNIDTFVQTELGYKTEEELFNALSVEQIDEVAILP